MARVRELRTTHTILVINPQENKQFYGPRSRWKETTAMNECFLQYREDLTSFILGRLAASVEGGNES